MRPTWMPLGCSRRPAISPIGSGIAAICSQPVATVSIALSSSFSRSISGAARPAASAAAMSLALAAWSAVRSSRSRRASACSAALRAATGAAAIFALAARAAAPMCATAACRSVAVMAGLSQKEPARAGFGHGSTGSASVSRLDTPAGGFDTAAANPERPRPCRFAEPPREASRAPPGPGHLQGSVDETYPCRLAAHRAPRSTTAMPCG